jgi:hypothetical protein
MIREQQWNDRGGKTEILGENIDPVPLYAGQIRTHFSYVSGIQLVITFCVQVL